MRTYVGACRFFEACYIFSRGFLYKKELGLVDFLKHAILKPPFVINHVKLGLVDFLKHAIFGSLLMQPFYKLGLVDFLKHAILFDV